MGVTKGRISQIERGSPSGQEVVARYAAALGGQLHQAIDSDDGDIAAIAAPGAAHDYTHTSSSSRRWTSTRRGRRHSGSGPACRFAPRTAVRNALEPVGKLPGAPFDSVGVNYLLHCLPGDLETKAGQLLASIRPTMAPDAVLFGSTILATAATVSRPARRLLAFYNRKGVFHNVADHAEALDRVLGTAFTHHRVELVGGVATFVASGPTPLGSGLIDPA
ncbi:hypothetical protein FAGKG844_190029 [Frankia sp. AgKG'84/4]|nr:hypothetical protein [Frankia sp. AgKG'84/4]